jgi:signal peptidase I
MRVLVTIRTFIASYIVPAWGFWIVGKPTHGLVAAAAIVVTILVFSWTRLVLNPVGYLVYFGIVTGIIFWAASHAAILEFRRDQDKSEPRNWKAAFFFAGGFAAFLWLLLSNKPAILGYDSFRLPSTSMAPTLLSGDYVVVDTWRYSKTDPVTDEIAVFVVPGSDGTKYIKRIVGLADDTLSIQPKSLKRNGKVLTEPFAFYDDRSPRASNPATFFTVPSGHYFVMGDNRYNSKDSRYIGPIPHENLIGPVIHIWYSRTDQNDIRWERFPMKID